MDSECTQENETPVSGNSERRDTTLGSFPWAGAVRERNASPTPYPIVFIGGFMKEVVRLFAFRLLIVCALLSSFPALAASLWNDGVTPANVATNDPNAVELGVRFSA